MTPEMENAINKAIEKYVNGGIRDLKQIVLDHNTCHESDMKEVRAHMAEVKPILEGYSSISTLGNLIKWFGGVVTAGGVIWALFFKN